MNVTEETIIKDCYKEILRYCNSRLNGDVHAAQDCTQEVFLTLHQKINGLDISRDIRPWLYDVADKKLKAYRRKHPETVDIDTIPEPAAKSDFQESILDVLNEEERCLAEAYYSGGDKRRLAQSQGITLRALYIRMSHIREKIRSKLPK